MGRSLTRPQARDIGLEDLARGDPLGDLGHGRLIGPGVGGTKLDGRGPQLSLRLGERKPSRRLSRPLSRLDVCGAPAIGQHPSPLVIERQDRRIVGAGQDRPVRIGGKVQPLGGDPQTIGGKAGHAPLKGRAAVDDVTGLIQASQGVEGSAGPGRPHLQNGAGRAHHIGPAPARAPAARQQAERPGGLGLAAQHVGRLAPGMLDFSDVTHGQRHSPGLGCWKG